MKFDENITLLKFYEIIVKFLSDSLEALTILHLNNIYHWDIKPENFIYDREEKTNILIDFETADIQVLGNDGHPKPVSNQKGKTLFYAAPERDDRFNLVNDPFKCDIYSLGKSLGDFITVSHNIRKNIEDNKICDLYNDFFNKLYDDMTQIDPKSRKTALELKFSLETFVSDLKSILDSAINYIDLLPSQEIRTPTVINLSNRLKIIDEIYKNKEFFHLYFDKKFFSYLQIASNLDVGEYMNQKNINIFFQMYMDISSSFFWDDPNYYYKIYVLNYINKALLYESYGKIYFNLNKFNKAIYMFKKSVQEYKKDHNEFEVLKIKFYLSRAHFILKKPRSFI